MRRRPGLTVTHWLQAPAAGTARPAWPPPPRCTSSSRGSSVSACLGNTTNKKIKIQICEKRAKQMWSCTSSLSTEAELTDLARLHSERNIKFTLKGKRLVRSQQQITFNFPKHVKLLSLAVYDEKKEGPIRTAGEPWTYQCILLDL